DASASEVYQEQVAAHGARFARPDAVEVRVVGDPSVPVGRYRLRQARPLDTSSDLPPVPAAHLVPAGGWPYAHDGDTRGQLPSAGSVVPGRAGVGERAHDPVPALRLVTGSSAAETPLSGARAGRGDVELPLPEVPTVSREHAQFTYADGQWWVTNLGRNGLTL